MSVPLGRQRKFPKSDVFDGLDGWAARAKVMCLGSLA